jgi:hypothetical protein
MSPIFPRATVDIWESEIPSILKMFRAFVGKEQLTRRTELADKMVASGGQIYGERFVRPRQALWLGTRELFRLVEEDRLGKEPLTPAALLALHHLATIRNVVHTMRSWKRADLRGRLTDKSGGDIPALIEIATASRAVTLGGTVKWVPEKIGNRTFDIEVSYKGQELEIECKAKSVDAGRRIARGDFYRFADSLFLSQPVQKLTSVEPRFVILTMNGRFPRDHAEQALIRGGIESLLRDGGMKTLADGSTLNIKRLTAAEREKLAAAPLLEFEHRFVTPALVLSAQSRRPDQVIANIERELEDALKHQLTGKRPGALICYVPEVETFEGILDQKTATSQMVQRFLSRSDASQIVSITFFSDPWIGARPGEIETQLPSVKYVANKFRGTPLEIF